jgi:hypothetical protein
VARRHNPDQAGPLTGNGRTGLDYCASFPDLLAALRERPVTGSARRVLSGAVDPPGKPGQVFGITSMSFAGPVSWESVSLYSARSWKAVLANLDRNPFTVLVQVKPLDGHSAVIHLNRGRHQPTWARFSFSASAQGTGWSANPQLPERWAAYCRARAATLGACAGSMTDDIGPGFDAAMRRAMSTRLAPISSANEALRGYSWVAVLAAELASRLGGADRLASTGAFYEVSPLPDGSLWLRATP